jgi:hypothetical protein
MLSCPQPAILNSPMNEVILQACFRKITTLDRTCLPDRIVVEFHRPLRDEEDMLCLGVARTWVIDGLDVRSSSDAGIDAEMIESEVYRHSPR